MASIPDELMQAAVTDCAGTLRTFWSVVLPVSRNATVTVSLFAFLWAWSDFVFARTLDSGGALRPITLGIYHYVGNDDISSRFRALCEQSGSPRISTPDRRRSARPRLHLGPPAPTSSSPQPTSSADPEPTDPGMDAADANGSLLPPLRAGMSKERGDAPRT